MCNPHLPASAQGQHYPYGADPNYGYYGQPAYDPNGYDHAECPGRPDESTPTATVLHTALHPGLSIRGLACSVVGHADGGRCRFLRFPDSAPTFGAVPKRPFNAADLHMPVAGARGVTVWPLALVPTGNIESTVPEHVACQLSLRPLSCGGPDRVPCGCPRAAWCSIRCH